MAKKITAADVKNDAAFDRTRENAAEFARCGAAAKFLRDIFREPLVNFSDGKVFPRLVKTLSRVTFTDPINDRGNRTVQHGDVTQLEGFNFNKRAGLRDTLYARHTLAFDRATGRVTVNIPSFVPRLMVQAGKSTTHFRIMVSVAAVNFDTDLYDYVQATSGDLLWDNNPTAAISLMPELPPNSPDHVFIMISIELCQKVNNKLYVLKNASYAAASIVKVYPKV